MVLCPIEDRGYGGQRPEQPVELDPLGQEQREDNQGRKQEGDQGNTSYKLDIQHAYNLDHRQVATPSQGQQHAQGEAGHDSHQGPAEGSKAARPRR